ncbi:CDGSH iron-sulfur domain-containing protein [Microbacterium sp. SLBN-146]|uniref:CDGSH iron-sulfur domain-containing protein n=1 Tax=Microbacterium sp. SLBN-146 TaxID=2768457 RepID=UPI00114F2990|nr:CDGSH iron-sulfur domain-containing protein [Microbacterium sp. SLBN-146]TQJ30779.1 iron-binding CDGSH zinc finger protein [Microbacterium sp. SLBN-146]
MEPRPTTITAYPDGPLIVRGEAVLIDEHGEPIRQPRRTVALCRCGVSAIKPWCDGTHKLTGFRTSPGAADVGGR